MSSRGWSWVMAAKSLLVASRNTKVMAGRGWSWMVVGDLGWSHDLIMPLQLQNSFLIFSKIGDRWLIWLFVSLYEEFNFAYQRSTLNLLKIVEIYSWRGKMYHLSSFLHLQLLYLLWLDSIRRTPFHCLYNSLHSLIANTSRCCLWIALTTITLVFTT